mgnify:CR=1 FL=1
MQQVRRQTSRHFAEQVIRQRLAGEIRWQPGAQQQGQAVFVLGHLAGVACQCHAGVFHRGPRLAQVESRGHANFVAARGELEALLVCAQGVLGELEQFLVGLPGQVGVGHAGHQADLGTAPCLFGGEVLLQGFFAQAAYATEQVQLIGTDPEAGRVLAGDSRFAALRQLGRGARTAAAACSRHSGEQISTLDLVLRGIGVDVQGRDTQVTVVHQCGLDQLLQGRVMEKLLPALLGSGLARRLGRRIRRPLWELSCHRRFMGMENTFYWYVTGMMAVAFLFSLRLPKQAAYLHHDL